MKKEFLKDENGNVIGRKRGRYVDVRVNVSDAYIKLKNGKQIIVDKADLEKVLMLTWESHPYHNKAEYVCHRFVDENGKFKCISLASYLLGTNGKSYTHKNGNTLDYRRVNMVKKNLFGRS